jgi:hypothetical protein
VHRDRVILQRKRRAGCRILRLAVPALLVCLVTGIGQAQPSVEAMILVRSSPLAGFQFHAGEELWRQMQVGDRLTLVREPENPHDPNAIRVDWRQVKLGYVPRRDNRQVARQIDLGAALEARISKLRESRNPWDRIEFEVVLVLPGPPAAAGPGLSVGPQ